MSLAASRRRSRRQACRHRRRRRDNHHRRRRLACRCHRRRTACRRPRLRSAYPCRPRRKGWPTSCRLRGIVAVAAREIDEHSRAGGVEHVVVRAGVAHDQTDPVEPLGVAERRDEDRAVVGLVGIDGADRNTSAVWSSETLRKFARSPTLSVDSSFSTARAGLISSSILTPPDAPPPPMAALHPPCHARIGGIDL